jgi:RNA polymerase sigma-70 factor (ECF subfamily)
VGYRYWKQTKRQRRRENFSFKDWDQLLAEPSERMDPSQAAALVHELLAQLPPRDRLVLTLRYLQELDVAEAARRTGWSKTMVKVQTWRALKKLQKIAARAGKEISLS